MNRSRIVLRDLALALVVLAVIISGLFIWLGQSNTPIGDFLIFAESEMPPPTIVDEITTIMNESGDIRRYITDRHEVRKGESFSLITGKYWEDIFLWPDLYLLNDMRSDDPDLIFPEEIIDIYNRLGRGEIYTVNEREMILDAYIEVYDIYKALGPSKNSSAWTLLWCGAKYDHDFLEKYSYRIDPADQVIAERYIAEEGYLD